MRPMPEHLAYLRAAVDPMILEIFAASIFAAIILWAGSKLEEIHQMAIRTKLADRIDSHIRTEIRLRRMTMHQVNTLRDIEKGLRHDQNS